MKKFIQRADVVEVGHVRITEKTGSQAMYFEVKIYSSDLECIATEICEDLDEVMGVLQDLKNTHDRNK